MIKTPIETLPSKDCTSPFFSNVFIAKTVLEKLIAKAISAIVSKSKSVKK
jgi:hypothetical protein